MEEVTPRNFIEEFVESDIKTKNLTMIQTRFPPEPNGYLHIGHAKALYVDFSIAEKYGGKCNLRFDDTNPSKEDEEFVDAIMQDIKWLGYSWDKLRYGSDYFEICYEKALLLIKKGLAYVCDLNKDEIREYRGTLTAPGKNSPYRDRCVEENLSLFARMRAGDFPDGFCTLRAKIDMSSPNINMRDPAIYRILHKKHHHTLDAWCIYPMYDFAHPIQDAIEGVTHSLCSLEYESHRPLYDWVVDVCEFESRPRQIEFSRLNLTNTVMSKRYLRRLVEEGYVDGWDDPRMPTLCAMRRRGFSPTAILDFLGHVGIAKSDSVVDTAMLEHCVRNDLNLRAHRVMAVLNPLKVTLTNYEPDAFEPITIENLPNDPNAGNTTVRFCREIYIERDDFSIDPPKKFFRLKPGGEVRLKGAYIIKCNDYITDESGNVTEVLCTYDESTKSGECDRKVKATIQWLPIDAVPAEFRLYDSLLDENKNDDDFINNLNENSLTVVHGFIEPSVISDKKNEPYQFMRVGYFVRDGENSDGIPVFDRTVGLKDSYKPI
ncbi:MAG: glutamine--tRNA ligase/YqeY domain fusion protein [Clostridia bacterium]